MATSFIQKLRLGIRGWSRRREEAADNRDAEFLKRSTSWGTAQPPQVTATKVASPRARFDLEGLQVAYLDDSGRIDHYLDVETGEVLDLHGGDRRLVEQSPNRYRRVPQRTTESEATDHAAFLDFVDKPAVRRALEAALRGSDPAGEFRRTLAQDRGVERAWYSFKNRRAAEAIERWLEGFR